MLFGESTLHDKKLLRRLTMRLSRRTLLRNSMMAASGAIIGAPFLSSRARADAGEVNIYSARHYPADEQLFSLFTKETGITVNQIKGTGEELMERIKLEGE